MKYVRDDQAGSQELLRIRVGNIIKNAGEQMCSQDITYVMASPVISVRL